MVSEATRLNASSRRSSRDFDIVVVGGGIVGCALALAAARATVFKEFGLRGGSSRTSASAEFSELVSVALIEASEVPEKLSKTPISSGNDRKALTHYDSRVVALSHASRDFLKQLGVWPLIESHDLCSYQSMEVWDGEGTGKIRFSAEDLQQDSLGCIVENRSVVAALYEKLEQQNNVEIFRGTRVEDLSLVEEGLHSSNDDSRTEIVTDQNQIITGRLIVAADGAKSKVRNLAGIDTREWSYDQSAIVCTVRTERTHENTAWQRFSQQGPLAFLPLSSFTEEGVIACEADGNTYSSIVWSLDTAIAEEKMLLDEQAFCADLSQTFEHRLGKVQIASTRYIFPLVQCHAKTYFKSDVVVVGDAAHSIHPLAGQGVNLGLADAKVLSAEIIRAGERGFLVSDSSVVKRYQRQRQSHNLAAMSAMEFFKHFYGADNLILRYLRNRGMSFCDKQNELKKILATLAIGDFAD